METIKIYTIGYFPFTMGGEVYRPICCKTEGDGPHALGKGYEGYVVLSPEGHQAIAEAETGALVGPNLASVRHDIETGDEKMMTDQIAQARVDSERAQDIGAEKFWSMLHGTMEKSAVTSMVDSLLEE